MTNEKTSPTPPILQRRAHAVSRDRRIARYQEIAAAHQAKIAEFGAAKAGRASRRAKPSGWSMKDTARELGLSVRTVERAVSFAALFHDFPILHQLLEQFGWRYIESLSRAYKQHPGNITKVIASFALNNLDQEKPDNTHIKDPLSFRRNLAEDVGEIIATIKNFTELFNYEHAIEHTLAEYKKNKKALKHISVLLEGKQARHFREIAGADPTLSQCLQCPHFHSH